VTGQPVDYWTFSRAAVATQLRQHQPAAMSRLADEVRSAVANQFHTLALEIVPSGDMRIADSKLVEAAFQAYAPDNLGVIEYHSASCSYSRQPVGGIDLNARNFEEQRRQQRLCNWQAKYHNVKTELAASYLRNIIARESGHEIEGEDLNDTLQELSQTFFPDKTYEDVRPQAQGSLEFPVRLSTSEVHDIDELSSGEEEILYGYLKLKNSTPGRSVILLDEPELHLNPSLLKGFADFYHRHLGVAQDNQLWLVTHSDTLLRQAVGNANYRVYQMVPATAADSTDNQAVEILKDDDVELVTIELVGDLASYRPHGKVVIFEGRSEDGFDVHMVQRLFPEFAQRVNLLAVATSHASATCTRLCGRQLVRLTFGTGSSRLWIKTLQRLWRLTREHQSSLGTPIKSRITCSTQGASVGPCKHLRRVETGSTPRIKYLTHSETVLENWSTPWSLSASKLK
jgi:hypothetical protein